MKSDFLSSLGRNVLIRWSKPLTALMLVLALVGAYFGSKVQLKLSLTDLLPDRHPAVVKFEKLTEVVGGVGFLAIVLEAPDGKSHLEAAPVIAEELRKSPLVRSVYYNREARFFTDRMLYYSDVGKLKELEENIDSQIKMSRRQVFDIGLWDEEPKAEEKAAFDPELKKLAKKSASISPYLMSKDRRHLLVMVKPSFDSTDMGKTEALVNETEALLKLKLPPGVTHEFAERYYNKIVESRMIEGDIFLLGTLAIVLIGFLLWLYLRSFRALLVIFVPVFAGLGITFGLTYLVIGHINIITGFLMGIVSGLGVDYGIHLVLRMRLEKREPSTNDPDPVWRTLASSGHAVFTGAVAAAFAFYLLCFSSFRAFSEFGFICGTGIIAVLICLLVSFSTMTRWLGLDEAANSAAPIPRFTFPVLSLPRGVLVGSLLTVATIVAGFFVRFEYDFEKMMRHSAKMEALSALVDDIYERSVVPAALSVPTREEALEVEKILKDRYIPSMVSELISGASIVPEQQQEKAVILGRIGEKLGPIRDRWIEEALDVPAKAVRNWVAAKPYTFADIPPHVQDSLRGTQQKGFLIYIYPAMKLGQASTIRAFAGMIKEIEGRFPDVLTGSDAVIFSDILDLIKHDGFTILAVIFISVGFFIWINVRKWDDTLLSYLPLLISLPVGMGLMVIFGVKFNIFNIAIIPTFVAMGIDVPIHVVHRAREVGSGYKAAKDLASSVNLALLTAAVGFGVLVFARAGVLKSLGWIALLGTLAIWWVGIFMLPAFMEWLTRRGSPALKNMTEELPVS